MQPVMLDERGVVRFRPNRIVQWMLAEGEAGRPFDLNRIARELDRLDPEEHEQFNQLIGYSVSGFGDLSCVRPETVERADQAVAELLSR